MKEIVNMAKALASENRVATFLNLCTKKRPVDIAGNLGISRAGLQKHLEGLEQGGFIRKKGSGRNTKYVPTEHGKEALTRLQKIAEGLKAGKELNQMHKMIETLQTISKVEGTDTMIDRLYVEIKERSDKIKEIFA